jgi:alpha-beta hydrolase superfamily lysophospholipase
MMWAALLLVSLLVAAVAALAIFGTQRLLTLPRPSQRSTPAGLGVPFEDVAFSASDGVVLRGWFFARAGAPVIIYCPGRGAGLNEWDFRYAPIFYQGGYQVLMFDWRGMGASGGRTSMGYWEKLDLKAAVAYARQRAPTARMGAMGTSLGAAVIFLATGDIPEIEAVAGESSFATFENMVADGIHVLYGLPRWITRPQAWLVARISAWIRRFPLREANPVQAIHRICPRPVFVIHGRYDRHVPVAAGIALYEAAGEPKTIWLTDTAHTSGLEKLGDEYGRRLLAFFDAHLKSP